MGRDFINRHKAWMVKDGMEVKVCDDKWLVEGDKIWQKN